MMLTAPLSVHCLPPVWVHTVGISKVALLSPANRRECRAFHISHCLSLAAPDGERTATEKPVGRGANSEQGDARGPGSINGTRTDAPIEVWRSKTAIPEQEGAPPISGLCEAEERRRCRVLVKLQAGWGTDGMT
jgi:hypothetical protein